MAANTANYNPIRVMREILTATVAPGNWKLQEQLAVIPWYPGVHPVHDQRGLCWDVHLIILILFVDVSVLILTQPEKNGKSFYWIVQSASVNYKFSGVEIPISAYDCVWQLVHKSAVAQAARGAWSYPWPWFTTPKETCNIFMQNPEEYKHHVLTNHINFIPVCFKNMEILV